MSMKFLSAVSSLFQKTRSKLSGVSRTTQFLIVAGIAVIGLVYAYRPGYRVQTFNPTGSVTKDQREFSVRFNRSVADPAMVRKEFQGRLIEFTPPLFGRYVWRDRQTLVFILSTPLSLATHYTARVLPEAAQGRRLTGQTDFQFNTPAFLMEQALAFYEKPVSQKVPTRVRIGLTFNYPVAQKDLLEAMILKDAEGKDVSFSFETVVAGTVHSILTESMTRERSQDGFQVMINPALKCVQCGDGLGKAVNMKVIPQKAKSLEVKSMTAEANPKDMAIRVEFSSPVDVAALKSYVVVSPEIKFATTSSFNTVTLRGDFVGGRQYTVTLREGLKASDGSALESEVKEYVSFEEIEPSLSFTDEGFYLPRRGEMNVGIESVNIPSAELVVDKVYLNNLVYLMNNLGGSIFGSRSYYRHYYYQGQYERLGKHVSTETLQLGQARNVLYKDVTSLKTLLSDKRKGLYHLYLRGSRSEGYGREQDSKWVLLTDIGLIARKTRNSYVVFANSLTTLRALPGVQLKLLSSNNQLLTTAVTDDDGKAVLEGITAFEKEGFEPYLVTATLADDESFLLFGGTVLPLADYDIAGRDQPQGLQGYLFMDRGVYRPGDRARLAGILRTAQLRTPDDLPVKVTLIDPQSKVFRELVNKDQKDGAFEFDVEIPSYAKTGRYEARMTTGDPAPIGTVAFNVEDFIPDRIRVSLATEKETYQSGEEIQVKVQGDFLFGAPAAGQKSSLNVYFMESPFRPKGFSEYVFGDRRSEFKNFDQSVAEGALDERGAWSATFKGPEAKPRGYLSARLVATVLEEGGRAVSGYRNVEFHPYPYYLGLRSRMKSVAGDEEDEGGGAPGKLVLYDLVAVDPEGKPVKAGTVRATLYRKVWQSLYRKDENGRYRYVSDYQYQIVKELALSLGASPIPVRIPNNEYGEFMLEVASADGRVVTTDEFSAWGWGRSSVSMAKPDRLEVELDKANYEPGETAKVRVRGPFSGKLLLTVERDDVYWSRAVSFSNNTGVIAIPVTDQYKPNVYVTATLLRTTDSLDSKAPARAFGLVRLNVSRSADRMNVKLEAPETLRPETEMTVRVKAPSGAQVILAAVDSGILQLTGFQPPDPYAFFYGPLKLNTVPMDLYSWVLPEILKGKGPVGGSDERRERNLGKPQVKRVKPVALWSGLVKTDVMGNAKVTFRVPEFDGELRLMAVAFKETRFGNASSPVIVRSPLVLSPSLPRFLCMGDEIDVPVGVFNGTEKDATIEVEVESKGPLDWMGTTRQSVPLKKGEAGHAKFKARVLNRMEPVTVKVTASGAGESSARSTAIPVRSAKPLENFSGSGAAPSGKTTQFQFPANLTRGTDRYSLMISGLPTTKYAGGLRYLLHYPYGCIEQTTSSAFPLLYFNEVARVAAPDVFRSNSSEYFVREGIRRIESMMDDRGEFSYWPGGSYSNYWCGVYAAHFLAEARKKGFSVSERVVRGITANLKTQARGEDRQTYYSYYDGDGDSTRVYACYVLALLGDPDKGTMNYFKEQKLDSLTLESRAQLAMAYILTGDSKTARAILPPAAKPSEGTRPETGGVLSSSVREAAILMEAYLELDPQSAAVPALLKFLGDAAPMGRWGSTQENSFALKALGKAYAKLEGTTFTGTIRVGGREVKTFDSKGTSEYTDEDLAGKTVEIVPVGQGSAYYYWEADGVTQGEALPEDKNQGLQVRRVYKDKNGNNLNLSAVPQGELVVAQVTLSNAASNYQNLVVVDLLPAGFEVENPRLQSREVLPWVADQKTRVDFLDLRDDRVLFFLPLNAGQTVTYTYTLRAITAGVFRLPPVKAEAMYDPGISSIGSAGGVTVATSP